MNKFIIGNLKMNIISPEEREKYFADFGKAAGNEKSKNTKIILCPPFVHLESFINHFRRHKFIQVGSQNVFWEEKGSYTGEISPLMVKKMGANFAIVGHSERRNYLQETDEAINLKIKACLKAGIIPIFCLGETREEKEMDLTAEVIINQLREGLNGINKAQIEKIIFVYEPVWAVGTDSIPGSNDIMSAKLVIRKILSEKYGSKIALKPAITYGGSVNSETAKYVCLDPGMDGVLVGRESLAPSEFIKIATLLNG